MAIGLNLSFFCVAVALSQVGFTKTLGEGREGTTGLFSRGLPRWQSR